MVTIKKAAHKDTDSIKSLWCEFMDFHEQYDSFYKIAEGGDNVFGEFVDKQISDRNALVLIARKDNHTCAYLLARIENRPHVFQETKHGVIYDVAVSADYRRQGIGELLYDESVKWFKKRKVKRIELTVASSNPVSKKFWSKLGFEPFSEQRYIELK